MNKIKKILKKIIPASYKKGEDLCELAVEKMIEVEVRKTPKVMLDYEVQLVEHCNLNCKYCSHFCPVAKEGFLDVNEYERDCKRLSELFNKEVNFIRLMGGEPLLHPDIAKFCDITRKYFPNGTIDIDTNGILILSMKENFWKALRENKINLTVTRYPLNLDIEAIKNKCKKENVSFRFFCEQPVETFNHLPLDLEGRGQIEKNFYRCYLANSCHTLKHGKMYTCSTVPHIHQFTDYFKCDLKLSENEGIDIYKAQNKDEILNFLAKPIPFCRYCNIDKRETKKWEISQKKIEEWI